MTNREKENYEKYYKISKVLGKGAFGIIYKGRDKKNKEFRAIKAIDLKEIKQNLINEYDG